MFTVAWDLTGVSAAPTKWVLFVLSSSYTFAFILLEYPTISHSPDCKESESVPAKVTVRSPNSALEGFISDPV